MQSLTPSFLRYFIYNNALVSAMDTLATGTLLTAYALALGASSLTVGILGGLPYIGPVVSAVGAFLVYKGWNVKKITVGFSFASRPFYLVGALLAFMPQIPHVAWWLVGCVGLCYLMGGLSSGAYYPWLKSLLPEGQTHPFVAQKYTASMGAHLAGFLGAFLLLRWISDKAGNPPLFIYAVFFAAAFVFGMVGTGCLLKVPASNHSLQEVLPAKQQIKQMLTRYRSLLLVIAFSMGTLLFTTTFVPVFALQIGGLCVTKITALAIIGQLAFLGSLPLWKHWNERKDSLESVKVAFALLSCFLLFGIGLPWMTPSLRFCFAGLLFIITFVAQAGIQAGLDATVLLAAPKEQSAVFFAVVSWVKLTAALGPMLAGLYWAWTERVLPQLGTIGCWQLFFVLCALGGAVTEAACEIFRKQENGGI